MSIEFPPASWDESDFKVWLGSNGISARVARDFNSRCLRVERALGLSLAVETESEEKFRNLMVEIQRYSQQIAASKDAAYVLTGSLRAAVRKLAIHLYGSRALSYPRNYRLSSYKGTSNNPSFSANLASA